MQVLDQTVYDNWKHVNNHDGYGRCIFLFAESWANKMEQDIAEGRTIPEIANKRMQETDNEPGFGITGFMYGAVISTLSHCWIHGENLRRWHNRETQIGDEDDRANEDGRVLNPTFLCIGK